MANRVIIDKKLPVQFYIDGLGEDAQYLSKHINDWRFSETILPWEQRTDFALPVNLADLISLQLQSNVGPVNLELYSCDDILRDTVPFQVLQQNVTDPTMYIRECDLAMITYPEGGYYLKIKFGSPVILSLISEKIILSEKNENTLFLEFTNYRFLGDMIFETGYRPAMRIPGTLKYESPESNNVLYEDDDNNAEMLDSVPFDIWKLTVGLAEGVPDHIARKVNRQLGCSDFQIDGKYLTRAEGSKMERLSEKDYPMSAWAVDLRETDNSSSMIYENEEATEGFIAVMINSDSKGFGADTGGNETVITDIT